jgi:hypothetical protein
MTKPNTLHLHRIFAYARYFTVLLLALGLVSMAGCGSTKVYTAQKTIVYRGDIYNLGNVQKVGSRVEGMLKGGDVVNMRSLDKKGVEALLKENAPVTVSAIVELDDKDMVYRRGPVNKYSEYSSMMKSFDRALKDISKFMADKKKTQLTLK